MKTDSWGYHLLYNGTECPIDLITSKKNITEFVDTLVDEIDMVAYGSLWIERFAIHDPEKSGYSFFQMIETSHIAGHFCENSGDCFIDIFSCKPFEQYKADMVIDKFFLPKECKSKIVLRDRNLPLL